MDKTLANKKNDVHISLKSMKTSKNNFAITLKITIFGVEANRKVTLVVDPS